MHIVLMRDHDQNAFYALLDKDGLCLLVRKLRRMDDDAFGDYLRFLSGEEEIADVRFYGLDLGHVQRGLVAGAG